MFRAEVELHTIAAEPRSCLMRLQIDRRWTGSCIGYRVAFSPDLSLVVLNDVVYALDKEVEYATAAPLPLTKEKTISNSEVELEIMSSRSHMHAMVSACNSFLVCVDIGSPDHRRPPKLELYRIMRTQRTAVCRCTLPPEVDIAGLAYALAKWHPTQPILSLITWKIATITFPEEIIQPEACYVLNLSHPNTSWIKAEKTSQDRCTFFFSLP